MSDNPKTDMPLTLAEQKLILRLRQLAKASSTATEILLQIDAAHLFIKEKRDTSSESLGEIGA